MRLLCFQARRFAWKSFLKTLEDVPDQDVDEARDDALVAFIHLERRDEEDRARVFRHMLKHVKWLANKRKLETVVLHSFTHLGADTADAEFARAFMQEMDERLQSTGYQVAQTPFGYFCSWQLDVYGESLAKVYKEI
ncbi:MAG: hypothetical protein KC503_25530 [Myxococcales bacterium]|nr:hypothetical protein [Myxococcales bacterium]